MTGLLTIGGLDRAATVVTGGASGIGAACRTLLEASNAFVVVVDRAGELPSTSLKPQSARRLSALTIFGA